ncbi:ADP-L-glycero-D-manno-heptose-6-epimerase [subsurface metagenome]
MLRGGRVANYLKEKEPYAHILLTTRKKNRKLPQWTERFSILEMDILDEPSIVNCLRDKEIDIILHLAALNEIDSMRDPKLALEVNTKGTYRLLDLAYKTGIKSFIYFSTFHVYGDVLESVIMEETPTKPFHPYAITHRAAEDFVNYFKHYYGVKTLIFRLSNGYGYPMHKEVNRWTLVFNDLCKQAVTEGKILLKSSGKQCRDFISLHDAARAVRHFIFVAPDRWGDGLYNLGGNCSTSIFEVAQKISDVYRSKYKKEINIETKQDESSSIVSKPVKYNIEKLMGTGFALKGDMFYEIDKTMDLCEEFII